MPERTTTISLFRGTSRALALEFGTQKRRWPGTGEQHKTPKNNPEYVLQFSCFNRFYHIRRVFEYNLR